MTRSRIAFITLQMRRGGAEYALVRLVRELSNRFGYECHIISLYERIDDDNVDSDELNVHYCGLNKSSLRRGLYGLVKLTQTLRSIEPQIIQTWMYVPNVIGVIIASALGYRNIFWGVRSSGRDSKMISMRNWIVFLGAFMSHLLPRAVIYCGHNCRLFHERLLFNKRKGAVVHNGFVATEYGQFHTKIVRSEMSDTPDDIVVICLTRYSRSKDIDTLLNVIKLVKTVDDRVKFALIGRNLEESPIHQKIQKASIKSHTKILGFKEDVRPYLASSDIFLSTSKSEGFPNSLCEAMLMQIPVVTTNAGESEAIVGADGFVSEVGDASSLAAHILFLASMSSEERNILGRSARQRATERFSLTNMAIGYHKLYEESKERRTANNRSIREQRQLK